MCTVIVFERDCNLEACSFVVLTTPSLTLVFSATISSREIPRRLIVRDCSYFQLTVKLNRKTTNYPAQLKKHLTNNITSIPSSCRWRGHVRIPDKRSGRLMAFSSHEC